MTRRFDNVIFDLDGTLIDSIAGIEVSARHAVARCLPGLTVPDLRRLIGPPIRTMLATLWPERPAAEIDTVVAAFREHYDSSGCLHSAPYPGVRETLVGFRNAGITMFVLTNKLSKSAHLILEQAGLSSLFRTVMSPDSVQPPYRKKRDGAVLLRDRFELDPARSAMVGDGLDDLEAAGACGFTFLAVSYGYGSAAEAAPHGLPVAHSFSDIARLLL